MRDRLIELMKELSVDLDVNCGDKCYTCQQGCIGKLADHLIANGVIVPPCKVGDAVWFMNTHSSIAMRKNAVYEAKVVRVYVEKDNILCLSIQIKNEWGTTEYPRITEIGKTVFLTREEAEKALAEREGKE